MLFWLFFKCSKEYDEAYSLYMFVHLVVDIFFIEFLILLGISFGWIVSVHNGLVRIKAFYVGLCGTSEEENNT